MPVTITCADYHEQMKMYASSVKAFKNMYVMHYCRLAVGTDRGVIILDTKTNNLIQVIGSEKKLMRKLQ